MAEEFDVIVIGGGPAGMMAAGRAAELGERVLLLEKNESLGKKLLITGGGRCNILNAEFDTRRLTEKYGPKGKSLFSLFSQLDAQATIDFFASKGLKIKVEAEKRAFPMSERSEDVLRTMVQYLQATKVELRLGAAVRGIKGENGTITGVILDNEVLTAKRYIVATGGKSRPETGSTGEGFLWLEALGHTVVQPDPALVPVTLSDPWTANLSGVSLKDVRLTAWQDGKKVETAVGKMLFTHTGLSGPLVLNMSKRIGELLKTGPVLLTLDLYPKDDEGALDARVLAHFETGKNKMIRNNIGDLVAPKVGQVLLEMAGIDKTLPLHQLTREQRLAFTKLLKAMPMHPSGLLGADKAIVTGGGVLLKEVDFKTMRSKLYDNLYLAGDVLDFDRPSGGFSLQICWSTGWVAGGATGQQ